MKNSQEKLARGAPPRRVPGRTAVGELENKGWECAETMGPKPRKPTPGHTPPEVPGHAMEQGRPICSLGD